VCGKVGLEQRLDVDALAMLRRDEHALDLDRASPTVRVLLVAHRDLRLAVRPQIEQVVRLPHRCEPPRETVREHDRHRHQLLRLVGGVAEHHPLVTGADLVERVLIAVLHLERRVDTLRDVGRLLVQRDHHAAGLGVEPVLRARVADLADPLAHEPRNVDVRVGRDLARDHDEPRRDQRLAGDAARRIIREHGVENGIRDLVGDLVRVALGDRLGREGEGATGHGGQASRRRGTR
jgi:hypothetical protein